MQERYLGDVHDFMKYALMRHLHKKMGISLGLNWYLTCPSMVDRPGNNDGNNRYHLNGGVWDIIDSELRAALQGFAACADRKIDIFELSKILPLGTRYHSDPVPNDDRDIWHAAALAKMSLVDLVFLDPDNGLQVPSMSRRTAPKYAYDHEVASYLHAGKMVICVQFARQCNPEDRAAAVRARLDGLSGAGASLPTIRCRVSPNILFMVLSPPAHQSQLSAAIVEFVEKCGDKAMLI